MGDGRHLFLRQAYCRTGVDLRNGKTNNVQPRKGQLVIRQRAVCPWWLCFTFDNALRRFVHNPERILQPYVVAGWTVLDVGPGMGYFTIALARMVGDTGKVIAADMQPMMLEGIRRRALRARMLKHVVLRNSTPISIGIREPIDFCLCFWMLHEVPDQARFLQEIFYKLKLGGLLLISEPKMHVSRASFSATVKIAKSVGFNTAEEPKISLSHSILLVKKSKLT
jgi:ubiquinone/menaquinone biosynthesis C-methylase UbiE